MPRGSCEDGTTCSYFDENPAGGLQSFDSVAWAFVTILQVMTFDTWTDAMFALMNGFSYYAWIYFVAIAVLGGLFVVNLFLCVIFDEFMKSQEAEALLSAVLPPWCRAVGGVTPAAPPRPRPAHRTVYAWRAWPRLREPRRASWA